MNRGRFRAFLREHVGRVAVHGSCLARSLATSWWRTAGRAGSTSSCAPPAVAGSTCATLAQKRTSTAPAWQTATAVPPLLRLVRGASLAFRHIGVCHDSHEGAGRWRPPGKDFAAAIPGNRWEDGKLVRDQDGKPIRCRTAGIFMSKRKMSVGETARCEYLRHQTRRPRSTGGCGRCCLSSSRHRRLDTFPGRCTA